MLLSSVLILSLLLLWPQSVRGVYFNDHWSSQGCLPSLPPWSSRKPKKRILHMRKTRSARGGSPLKQRGPALSLCVRSRKLQLRSPMCMRNGLLHSEKAPFLSSFRALWSELLEAQGRGNRASEACARSAQFSHVSPIASKRRAGLKKALVA